MSTASLTVSRLGRDAVQRWLPQLDAWLLPGAFYGVQHTWPQLYRRDGDGAFFGVFDGDRLVSHCASRIVTLRTSAGPRRANLIGSVATDPAARGRGHASQALAAALAAAADRVDLALLWAERPELYRRAGFVAGPAERALVLARRPRRDVAGVRLAEVADHGALQLLHAQKPIGVERSPATMSTLLTTPGMTTVVLERDGRPIAYACTGKGADLQGHWHELGGDDAALATLLPAAMHLTGQLDAVLLLPPYRPQLAELLGAAVVDEMVLHGPMVCAAGVVPPLWIDGLDSV